MIQRSGGRGERVLQRVMRVRSRTTWEVRRSKRSTHGLAFDTVGAHHAPLVVLLHLQLDVLRVGVGEGVWENRREQRVQE